MSVQILLQGRLLGIEKFLVAEAGEGEYREAGDGGQFLLLGRANWVALLTEVLPRALLAELGLAEILLGSSGGGQFLVVLPSEARGPAEAFLQSAAEDINQLTRSHVRLIWAVTENLGDWTDVRKRLQQQMQEKLHRPLAAVPKPASQRTPSAEPEQADEQQRQRPEDLFAPLDSAYGSTPPNGYFARELGRSLSDARTVGWSPEAPGRIVLGEGGKHTWSLDQTSQESIPWARHLAPADHGGPATLRTLASRAEGHRAWGVLRGDVDNFLFRLRRAQSIQEHLQLSMMYKKFFAGELAVLCSLPDFFRKVTILYAGGNALAVYGAWDVLPLLAKEFQRLFHRFVEENLKEFPGPEGKTITMAMAMAPAPDAQLATVFADSSARLEIAKSTDKDCIYLLGRTLEWKQLSDAIELKENLMRMAREYGSSRQFFFELSGVYRKAAALHGEYGGLQNAGYFDKPWRFHRRIHRVLGGIRDKEFQKLRSHLIQELSGRGTASIRLRPAGSVALEWARLGTEVQ
jgi:CRISPR-associated protein Csm1